MGYCAPGRSIFLQSSLAPSHPPPSSSSSSDSYPSLSARRKQKALVLGLREGVKDLRGNNKRRALILLGLSAVQVLQLRSVDAAVYSLGRQKTRMEKNPGPRIQDNSSYLKQDETEVLQLAVTRAPGNTFLLLLNELGILSSAVLGALYAISRKEKADMGTVIESMKTALTEKEDANASFRKKFDGRIQKQQEEHEKEIREFKEDKVLLSKELASAKAKVTTLRNELQNEKRSVDDIKLHIDRLHRCLRQAGEDRDKVEAELREKSDTIDVLQDRGNLLKLEIKDNKNNIDALTSALEEKESAIMDMSSTIEQAKVDLEEVYSSLAQLRSEHHTTKEELDIKNSHMTDLEMKASSLLAERDDLDTKFHTLQKEFNNMKFDFEHKLASNTQLMSNKNEEIHQLEEKIILLSTEAKSKGELIVNMTHERNNLSAALKEERNCLKMLRDELQLTQESLRDSELQSSDLLKQLQESNNITNEVVSELSRIETESSEAQNLLNASLNDARSSSKLLSDELSLVKDAVKKTKEHLTTTFDEIKSIAEARNSLKKELLEVHKQIGFLELELTQQRKAVTALNRALEESEEQIEKYSEERKNKEKELDETTRSLDETNKKASSLLKELDDANSRFANIEAEKQVLHAAFLDQKSMYEEKQEKLKDAESIIRKYESENESLGKKVKNFEEEIAAAKGEILRLRRQISTESNVQHKLANDVKSPDLIAPKRRGRRIVPSSKVSKEEA